MKKKIDILHVYAGTRGAMGLYINEIYHALEDTFKQEVIVSFFFPFLYGKKWFFKYTDISSLKLWMFKFNIVRNIFRYLELIITLSRTYIYILMNNVKYVNYGLTSDLLIELLFIKLLNFHKNIKVIITCHDVLPFGSDDLMVLSKKIKRKNRFFESVDFLIIHNENSLDDLIFFFKTNIKKVVMIPFPVMDLNKLDIKVDKSSFGLNEEKFTIGMFGNLRKEKGVEVMLNAWKIFFSSEKNAQLIIAGYIPPNLEYDFSLVENDSTFIHKKFIDDSQYKNLISMCDVVVVPYKRGTNSGIPSSIISCDTIVLASKIPMFVNNELILDNFLFKSETPEDLVSKIEWLYSLEKTKLNSLKNENKKVLKQYRLKFNKEVNEIFSSII
jgi:D-inositol-3-phosphate glycosyltransferase